MLTDVAWWKAVAERLIKTFAQTAVATILVSGVASAWDVPWWQVLGAAVLAAILSLLTSLASSAIGPSSGPSLTTEALHEDGAGDTPTASPGADPAPGMLEDVDDPRGQAAPGPRGRHERHDDEGVR